MTSVSQLVDLLARVTGISEDLISRHARYLIDAKILPKSKGRTIAKVSPKHAFKLLIAATATDRPADAPRIVERYWTMTLWGGYQAGFLNFGEHGAFLICETSKFNYHVWTKLWESFVQIERHYPGGSIKVGSEEPLRYLPNDFERDGERPAVRIEAHIPGKIICQIAAGLAGFSYGDFIDEIRARHDDAADPS